MTRLLTFEQAVLSGSYAASTSQVIDLAKYNAQTISIHNIFSVDSAAAKSFISGVAASKVIQDLTYTAKNQYAPAGNATSIAYIAGGTAGAETVLVTGLAIVVTIEDGVSTADEIKAAIEADVDANALVTITVSGTGTNAQDAVAATLLENGTGDVDIANDLVREVGHGFETGRKIALTTGGTLPTGLSATNYWLIKVDDDTFKFAASLVDALAGTAVNLTGYGTGTHTVTPAALSGASVKIQESNVNEDAAFVDISGLTSAISGTGSSIWRPATELRYMRLVFTITDGQVSLESNVVIKG